jgi:hypothetical protein
LEKGSYTQHSNETIYGIGPGFTLPISFPSSVLEDPRLHPLSNGSLLITLASVLIPSGAFRFHKVIVDINKDDTTEPARFSLFTLSESEKNWITLEHIHNIHKSTIYYIDRINPYGLSTVHRRNGSEVVVSMLRRTERDHVPFYKKYYDALRGSTPAFLMDDGYYLLSRITQIRKMMLVLMNVVTCKCHLTMSLLSSLLIE